MMFQTNGMNRGNWETSVGVVIDSEERWDIYGDKKGQVEGRDSRHLERKRLR